MKESDLKIQNYKKRKEMNLIQLWCGLLLFFTIQHLLTPTSNIKRQQKISALYQIVHLNESGTSSKKNLTPQN